MDAAIAKSAEPSSAKKRGRPAKDASAGTASKTTSPTKRGRPAKETATTAPAKPMTKATAKPAPTKKTAAEPGKRGRPAKAKNVVVASTAKSGSRSAKSSPQKTLSPKKAATPKKTTTTGNFPSTIGDVLNLTSAEIEDQWPDLAKNLSLEFHEDAKSKTIWGKFDIGIYEGYLRHKGLQLKQKMNFDYRSIENGTGEGNNGVCEVEFQGQKFTATFSECVGGVSVEGVMDTKKSGASEHDAAYFANGWEEYA